MLELTKRIERQDERALTLTLPFDSRQKSRLRTRLDNGDEVGLFLDRGQVLRDGDYLASDKGITVRVCAAPEAVTTVHCKDPDTLARACYHLGNRHVPLQIGSGWARYLQDHVLDEMVASLGLEVIHEKAPFEPEAGAYHGGHHHHHA